MNEMPDVSIILPTRNRATVIGRAIASVLAQTHASFELIIVDGASTDATSEIVAGFADPRIVYLREERASGVGAGENRGIAAARAGWIAFIDDDDEWLPTKLEVQWSESLNAPSDVGVVYTGRWLEKNGRRIFGPPPEILAKQGNIHVDLLNRWTFVPLVCAMVRRSCFDDVGGFDETLPTSNDYDLWIRMSARHRFLYVPEAHVIVHHTPGSVSSNADSIINARKMLLTKHAHELQEHGRSVRAFFYWQIGTLLIARGEVDEGRRYLRQAVVSDRSTGVYVASWLTSLLGRAAYLRARKRLSKWASPLRGT